MKQSTIILMILVFTIVYTAISWYVYSHGVKALAGTGFQQIFKWLFWMIASTFIIGQLLERGDPGTLARIVSQIGSTWLAFSLYILLFVLIVDIFRLIQHFFNVFPVSITSGILSGKMLFIYAVSIAFITTMYGYINARNPITNEIDLEINRQNSTRDSLKIVLATDVHLGVILGKNHARKLMEQINLQKPDIVLFGGDLVDHNPVPVVKNDLGACIEKIDAPLGTFAVTGNHEFISDPNISIDYFTKHNVKYVRDTVYTIDQVVHIIGREDLSRGQFGGEKRKSLDDITKKAKLDLPILLLDHQPFEYDKAEKTGVDLMMSGHTHVGQLWPFSYITNAIYENHFGLMKKGKAWFYTSSGYGTWGPPVRTGNRPELVVFNIKFV